MRDSTRRARALLANGSSPCHISERAQARRSDFCEQRRDLIGQRQRGSRAFHRRPRLTEHGDARESRAEALRHHHTARPVTRCRAATAPLRPARRLPAIELCIACGDGASDRHNLSESHRRRQSIAGFGIVSTTCRWAVRTRRPDDDAARDPVRYRLIGRPRCCPTPARSALSRETTSPARSARHTSTSMTLGSDHLCVPCPHDAILAGNDETLTDAESRLQLLTGGMPCDARPRSEVSRC